MQSTMEETCQFISNAEASIEEKRRKLQREELRFIERREELQREVLETANKVLTKEFLFLREYLVQERYNRFVSLELYCHTPIDEYPNIFDYYEKLYREDSYPENKPLLRELLKYKQYYRTVIKPVTLGVVGYCGRDSDSLKIINIESIEYDGKLHKRKQRKETFFPTGEVELTKITRARREYIDSNYSQYVALYETKGLWLERV